MLLLILITMANDGLVVGKRVATHDRAFFEQKIRPVLVEFCYECHATDSRELGGKLLLDSREGMRRGGESGPALVAGKPADSLIIKALRSDGLEMPPDNPLPQAVVNDFEHWVERGAPDPRALHSLNTATSEGRATKLWSLQRRTDPLPPKVKNRKWPHDPQRDSLRRPMPIHGRFAAESTMT